MKAKDEADGNVAIKCNANAKATDTAKAESTATDNDVAIAGDEAKPKATTGPNDEMKLKRNKAEATDEAGAGGRS